MYKTINKRYLVLLFTAACLITHAYEKDIILEFKAARFQPQSWTFKNIYGGGTIFGPEITGKIFGPVYGFASYDFFSKNGHSIGLNNATRITLQALAFGLKFMGCVTDTITLYAGVGFQPISLYTRNYSPYVNQMIGQWSFGGIAKFGAYIDLPHSIVLDLFADYSFVKVKKSCCTYSPIGYIQQTKASLSGSIFGVGLGYRFN